MENISFSLINLINIITLCVTMLFIFQIYFLKNRSKPNTFFSIYLANIFVILIFFLVLDLEYNMVAYSLIPVLLLAVLSIGPMLWIYVKLVTGGKLDKIKRHLYIPISYGLITFILVATDYILSNDVFSKSIRQIIIYIVMSGLTVVFIMQSIYYCYLSLILYKKHLKKIGETFSYTEKFNLSWFKLFIYGYLFFITGLILSHVVDDSISYIMFYITLLTYVIFSGCNALKQNPIFEEIQEDFKLEDYEIDNRIIETNNDYFTELKAKLLMIMDKDKLFLDSSLTIHSLASKLNSNTKYVSQLINNELNKNFVMFVNEYRINEAKELLLSEENDNLTIESIGYEVGFKSKSAFNRVFKQFTSNTPTQFKQDNR